MVPPLVAVAVKVTLVPAQMAPAGFDVILTLAATGAFTVIVMLFDVTGPVAQLEFDVITQVITSLLARAVLEYVEFVAPEIFVPFFFHWYVGDVPPPDGVAMKLTLSPAQMEFEGLAAILTLGDVDTVTITGVLELEHPDFCTCQL